MSRTGNWVLDMQEAAAYLTLQEFTRRYGYSTAEVWHDANFGSEPVQQSQEQELLEMDDGA